MKGFFISSTFKDMQAERDVLHERVFPRLRQMIKAYGEDVQEVDLRWGVDTVNMSEEESGHAVLTVCIDAIDRCEPYIIVLLGERYGWIPGTQIVKAVDDTRISDRYEEEMSITELEIRYGALLKEDAFSRCIFCLRDPAVLDTIEEPYRSRYAAESPRHRQRLEALKRQIEARPGATILRYSAAWDSRSHSLSGLERFEEDVYALLSGMIRQDLEGSRADELPEQQLRETKGLQEGYLSTYVRRYREEYALLKEVGTFLWDATLATKKAELNCVLLCGPAGTGKSALMAYAAHHTAGEKANVVLCFADTAAGRTPTLLKQYLVHRLEEILDGHDVAVNASAEERLRALDDKAAGKRIVCFVDGLDQIYAGEEKPYLDLPTLCPHIFWVFSALPEFPFGAAAADLPYQTIPVGALTRTQQEEMIATTAKRRGKKLDDQITAMLCERPGATNPLYLSLALQRFFMMNRQEFEAAEALAPGMDGLHRYMQGLLEAMPTQPEQMATYILQATAARFDQQQFRETLMLLAHARNGLTEQELTALLALEGIPFSPVGFQHIVSYLYDAFGRKAEGKWGYRHRLFGEAVRRTMTPEETDRVRRLFVEYALADDEFMQREGFYYIMEQQDEATLRVLESADTWNSKDEVLTHLGLLANEREDYRTFLTDLIRRRPAPALAPLFLTLEDWQFGIEVRRMNDEIIRILLDAGTVDTATRWRLAVRCLYAVGKTQEKRRYLDVALAAAEALEETGARQRALARVYAGKAYFLALMGMQDDAPAIANAYEKALAHVEQAKKTLQDSDGYETVRDVVVALKDLTYADEVRESPGEEQAALRALAFMEEHSRFANETTYRGDLCPLLTHLTGMYTKKRFRDYDKAKDYGERAIRLAEELVADAPTLGNLESQTEALYAYCKRLKDAYAFPYLEKAMLGVRRCYATARTDRYKRELAYATCYYAYAASTAALTRRDVSVANLEEYDTLWDRGLQMYEELLAANTTGVSPGSYAAFLADRTMIAYRRGKLQQAIGFGEKSVAVLEEMRTKTDDIEERYYKKEQLRWIDGWMARVKATLSNAHLDRLETEQAETYALAALPLVQEQGLYQQSVELLLLAAKAQYFACKNEEASHTCARLWEALQNPRIEEGPRLNIFRWETLYMQARLALKAEDAAAASALCRQAEALLPEGDSAPAYPRHIVLKADCMQAVGDPEAWKLWAVALDKWEKVATQELKQAQKRRQLNSSGGESRSMAIAAYYTAYCYYHAVTTPEGHRDMWQNREQALFAVLAHCDRPALEAVTPAFVPAHEIEQTVTEAQQQAEDALAAGSTPFTTVEELFAALEEEPDHGVQPSLTLYARILCSRPMLDTVRLTAEQLARLLPLLKKIEKRLWDERTEYKQAKEAQAMYRDNFPLARPLPVFTAHYHAGNSFLVWAPLYEDNRHLLWEAFLRLSVLALQTEGPIEEKAMIQCRDTAYYTLRGVTDLHGKNPDEDVPATVTDTELQHLLDCANAMYQLGPLQGYRLITAIAVELYGRTGDAAYIHRRLETFTDWLAKPYKEDAQETANICRSAVYRLMELLHKREDLSHVPTIFTWLRGHEALLQRVSSQMLDILDAYTATAEGALWLADNRDWVEPLRLRCYQQWLRSPLSMIKYR